jgi:hypothetical protein
VPSRPAHTRPACTRPSRTRAVAVSLALIALGAAALPRAAAAQVPLEPEPVPAWRERPQLTVGFSAAGLYSSIQQAAARDGFGFDAATWLGVNDFALGVGYQRTVHERGGAAGHALYEGFFVEPRVGFPLGVPFLPYVVGRVVRIQPLRGDGNPRGVQLSGGAGVLVAVAPRVRLDLGASYGRLRLDAASAAAGDRSSNVAQARAGLVVGVGRWTWSR